MGLTPKAYIRESLYYSLSSIHTDPINQRVIMVNKLYVRILEFLTSSQRR
jgi:hypothetical protein